jgi:hypothetical protein
MERCGYVTYRNPDNDQGLWRINGRRQAVYVKESLSPEQQLQAARNYVLRMQKTAGSS